MSAFGDCCYNVSLLLILSNCVVSSAYLHISPLYIHSFTYLHVHSCLWSSKIQFRATKTSHLKKYFKNNLHAHPPPSPIDVFYSDRSSVFVVFSDAMIALSCGVQADRFRLAQRVAAFNFCYTEISNRCTYFISQIYYQFLQM